MDRKPYFSGNFPFFPLIFPIFWGRPKFPTPFQQAGRVAIYQRRDFPGDLKGNPRTHRTNSHSFQTWRVNLHRAKFGRGGGKSFSAAKQRGRERKGPQKSSRNFVSETGRFRAQICSSRFFWKGRSGILALFGRRILGQYPAALPAPSSPGPF